jgi:hypothetical protein
MSGLPCAVQLSQSGANSGSIRRNINTFHLAFTGDGTAWAVCGQTLHRRDPANGCWRPYWDAPTPKLHKSCASGRVSPSRSEQAETCRGGRHSHIAQELLPSRSGFAPGGLGDYGTRFSPKEVDCIEPFDPHITRLPPTVCRSAARSRFPSVQGCCGTAGGRHRIPHPDTRSLDSGIRAGGCCQGPGQ